MTFQTVIDYAETISFNRRKKVAQTTSRDGTVKSTSLGGQVWEFEVKVPDGIPWSTLRPLIERLEVLDRMTPGTFTINNSNMSWLNKYLGNLSNITNVSVTFESGNTLTINSGASGLSAGQYRFRVGDLIQLGTGGGVYSVIEDVPYNGTTITVNRPIRDAANSYTLKVGPNVVWNVICVQFPSWTIFARDQVSWSGPFVFAEAL
jgi:hypothetical protein